MNDEEYESVKIALGDCQSEAEEGLRALARAHFYLDEELVRSEALEALLDVQRALTKITWR